MLIEVRARKPEEGMAKWGEIRLLYWGHGMILHADGIDVPRDPAIIEAYLERLRERAREFGARRERARKRGCEWPSS